jgi:hypothetical protein
MMIIMPPQRDGATAKVHAPGFICIALSALAGRNLWMFVGFDQGLTRPLGEHGVSEEECFVIRFTIQVTDYGATQT